MIVPLILFAVFSQAALSPRQIVGTTFLKIRAIDQEQGDQDARTIRTLNEKISKLAPNIMALGQEAVAPLSDILGNRKETSKTRIWASTFLGLSRHPSAGDSLIRVIKNSSESSVLRASCVSDLSLLSIDRVSLSEPLCETLGQENLPSPVVRSILPVLSRTGCMKQSYLIGWIKQVGPKPEKNQLTLVSHALAGLGNSPKSATKIIETIKYYPTASDQRTILLKGLLGQTESLLENKNRALSSLREILNNESRYTPNAVAAIRVLSIFRDPQLADILIRHLSHHDALVVVESARALSLLRLSTARAPIQTILDNVHADPRFVPFAGRPNPATLIKELEDALKLLP